MPKWTEYTTKDTLADNDEVMLYDATGRVNKRGLMSKFWDYVVDKMATAVISKLETNNKTIIGAINALNSDSKSLIIKKFAINDTPSTLHIRPNKALSHFSFLAFGDNNNNIFYAFGAKNSNYCYGCTVTVVSENGEFTISLSAWSYGIVVSADQFTCTAE